MMFPDHDESLNTDAGITDVDPVEPPPDPVPNGEAAAPTESINPRIVTQE